MKRIFRFLFTFVAVLALSTSSVFAATLTSYEASFEGTADAEAEIHFFGREDCSFCQKEKEFLGTLSEGTRVLYYDIVESDVASNLFDAVTAKHDLPKITPVTVVGNRVFQGFDSARVMGERITNAVSGRSSIATHLADAPHAGSVTNAGGCDALGLEVCEVSDETGAFVFDLPFIGVTDLGGFSLGFLALLLGFIDGFNPCAMWVLVTFLLILSQIGDKRKMIYVAGLFMLAEAIMYNAILNAWFATWDFVGLDAIVTPLVGFVALFGGLFFLYRWNKNRGKPLTCDISSIDSQMKTQGRIESLVNRPLTFFTALGIIGLAFSVNIIEFACSIGIPQAFTKILDLNQLSFLMEQWYILLYTLMYMVDDLVVFLLAIWGFSSLQSSGAKYSQLSLLIGGGLMLLLGLLLVFNPTLLVF